nr:hypothetical protein [Tanacetum cinerariifolium]
MKLEDSDGISTLPNTEIFEQLALIGVYTLGSDEGRMQQNELMDLVTKLTDRVLALETNLQQTKKVYSTAFTKLIIKEIKFETKDISTAKTLVYIRRSAYKDKDIQDTIEANEELALRIQAEEREKYSEAEKARLLVDLINQRKRHFAQQSAEERRNKPSHRLNRGLTCLIMQKTGESSEPREKEDDELTEEDLQQMVMIVPMEEDYVEALQDLVKERFNTTEPTDDKEKELCVKLKRLFKPDNDDTLWKLQRKRISIDKGAYDFNVDEQAVSRTIFRDGK